jgi:hypothetical protein
MMRNSLQQTHGAIPQIVDSGIFCTIDQASMVGTDDPLPVVYLTAGRVRMCCVVNLIKGAVMDWWAWLLIAIAVVLVLTFVLAFSDLRRYLRIRHM